MMSPYGTKSRLASADYKSSRFPKLSVSQLRCGYCPCSIHVGPYCVTIKEFGGRGVRGIDANYAASRVLVIVICL